MKIVVDGVFFQLAMTGISRVWSSVLPQMAKFSDLQIIMLDRGRSPRFEGIETIEFPSYKMNAGTATDSLLLDLFCKKLGADVFVSTYYTSPVTLPSVLMVYDMIPEVLGFDLTQRPWQEKQLAIDFASRHVCISENTRQDLERFYPGTFKTSAVAHCGLERALFHPQPKQAIEEFRRRANLTRPYFLLVGSREQHLGYKNASLAFKAARDLISSKIELVCVGGESEIAKADLAELPSNIAARRFAFTDSELACAYAGAEALIFPSRYEGFGMPVIEAMACACPVITTRHGSLGEVAGDAALFVSGLDPKELAQAMNFVRLPETRASLVEKGIKRASHYSWNTMAQKLYEFSRLALEESQSPQRRKFVEEWKGLRAVQAAVDPWRMRDL